MQPTIPKPDRLLVEGSHAAEAPDAALQADPSALRLARQIYAAWLQRCLQQGASRHNPGAVTALPRAAIAHQLDRALQLAGAEAAELLPLDEMQRSRLTALCSLIAALAGSDKQHVRAVQIWDRLIDLGLEVLQGFADMEIVRAAQRAAHDPLTGLPGRAALQQRLQAEQSLVLRHGRTCAVVMVDIDHFKAVNDQHGHQTGDRVLTAFARVLRGGLRPYDGVYRYGGEEFVLVLPGAAAAQAVRIVDRIRQSVVTNPLVQTQAGGLHISFSAGVAGLTERAIGLTLRCADQALYRAKAEGRDQVHLESCA
ncbi:MAG: GGDEF domain-containing protein [Thiomonas sp.]|nr:GGDEF domain-containing protein [Thiomonas sp.]